MALPCPTYASSDWIKTADAVQAPAPEPDHVPTMEITITEYFRLKRLADAYLSLGGHIKKLEQPS